MGLTNDISEYVGVRIAMHDALQRYYALDTSKLTADQKIALLQQMIRESCQDNRLLGNRNIVIGNAWAAFIEIGRAHV